MQTPLIIILFISIIINLLKTFTKMTKLRKWFKNTTQLFYYCKNYWEEWHFDFEFNWLSCLLYNFCSNSNLWANIYLSKVNNRNTRKRCEILSKLTIKTQNWRQWYRSGAFIINFEHISHLFLVFLLLILKK